MKAVLMVFALAAVCGAQQIDLGQSKAKHSEVELVSDSARMKLSTLTEPPDGLCAAARETDVEISRLA